MGGKDSMSWIQFHMGLAFAYSRKSPDQETKHGCIIVDQNNIPRGFGFNGLPRGAIDSHLPTTRPDKYPWMFHSEENALAHCEHRPKDCTAFVTGQCCNHCIYAMWQHGVRRVYMAKRTSHMLSPEDQKWFDEFISETGMEVIVIAPDLSWLTELGEMVAQRDFYDEDVFSGDKTDEDDRFQK